MSHLPLPQFLGIIRAVDPSLCDIFKGASNLVDLLSGDFFLKLRLIKVHEQLLRDAFTEANKVEGVERSTDELK